MVVGASEHEVAGLDRVPHFRGIDPSLFGYDVDAEAGSRDFAFGKGNLRQPAVDIAPAGAVDRFRLVVSTMSLSRSSRYPTPSRASSMATALPVPPRPTMAIRSPRSA